MTPHANPMPAPADRLVLFVADGLRADRFFELGSDGKTRAPYLRGLLETRARWGVSHTRVPTESRPGHVALIAGFYEDVSAVTHGWQENPVEFDSLFNETSHTFAFGSPDILPMFAKGAQASKVSTAMYDAHAEDFASNAFHLDTWVFERVEEMLENAQTDAELDARLRAPKTVIFLHLLGLDTTGHSRLPHSAAYLENIRLVDAGIQRMVDRIERFYNNDGKTAFVFSADHGMSDRGAHGDGDPHNTQTPLVVWGAGIAKPTPVADGHVATGHTELSAEWGLSHLPRRDVLQADVAPLMASLIGAAFPLNNVGTVPTDLLDVTEEFKAHALLTNAREVLAQVLVKSDHKARTEIAFRPFEPLRGMDDAAFAKDNERLIEAGKYKEAMEESARVLALSLRGLNYFQTYDWLFLRTIVSLGYLGWMANSFLLVVKSLSAPIETPLSGKTGAPITAQRSHVAVRVTFIVIQLCLSAYLVATSADWLYHAYALFPVYFWCGVIEERDVIARHVVPALRSSSVLLTVIGYFVALEVLVLSYFYRELLAVVFVLLPFYPAWNKRFVSRKNAPLWST